MKRILLSLTAIAALILAAKSSPASNGDPQTLQAAINSAAPGTTLIIPNGSYTWRSGVTCKKAIKIKGESQGGVTINTVNMTFTVFDLTENKDGNMELSNINFVTAVAPNNWVYAVYAHPWTSDTFRGGGRILLHDCKFKINTWNYSIEWGTNGGVIWNCDFDGGGLNGLSYVCHALNSTWTQKSTLGMDDVGGICNTYVEDCTFHNAYTAAMNPDDNSRIVVRHCTFDSCSTNSHGLESSPAGARHWEFYDNNWTPASSTFNYNYWMFWRGGTGVITDNYFSPGLWGRGCIGLAVFNISNHGQVPCQTHYPAARQVGQSWKGKGGYSYVDWPQGGTGYYTDPIYIWNNTGPGSQQSNFVYLSEYEPDNCGTNQKVATYVQLGRDYVLGPKPGYQKYTYPHPLRTGGGRPGPTQHPRRQGQAGARFGERRQADIVFARDIGRDVGTRLSENRRALDILGLAMCDRSSEVGAGVGQKLETWLSIEASACLESNP
jgi:hypothetical protein